MTVPQAGPPSRTGRRQRQLHPRRRQRYGFGLWADDFDGLTSGQLGKPVSAEKFVATISSQWADGGPANSPYLYALGRGVPRPSCPPDSSATTPDGTWPPSCTSSVATRGWRPSGWSSPNWSTTSAVRRWSCPPPCPAAGRVLQHQGRALGVRAGLRHAPTGGLVGRAGGALLRPHRLPGRPDGHETWDRRRSAVLPEPRWPEQGVTGLGDTILVDVPLHSDAAGHPGGR